MNQSTPRSEIRQFYDEVAEFIIAKADRRLAAKLSEKMLEAYKRGRRDERRRHEGHGPQLICDLERKRYSIVVDGVAVYDGLDPLGRREQLAAEARAEGAPPNESVSKEDDRG